ncbi:hypothetical protein D3C78_1063420 [compost metagenome]
MIESVAWIAADRRLRLDLVIGFLELREQPVQLVDLEGDFLVGAQTHRLQFARSLVQGTGDIRGRGDGRRRQSGIARLGRVSVQAFQQFLHIGGRRTLVIVAAENALHFLKAVEHGALAGSKRRAGDCLPEKTFILGTTVGDDTRSSHGRAENGGSLDVVRIADIGNVFRGNVRLLTCIIENRLRSIHC